MSNEPLSTDLTEAVSAHIQNMRGEKAKCTVKSRKYRLRAFSRWYADQDLGSVHEITEGDILEYATWCREENQPNGELTPNTLHARLFALRQFLRFCGDENLVPDGLYLEVPLPEVPTKGEDRQ